MAKDSTASQLRAQRLALDKQLRAVWAKMDKHFIEKARLGSQWEGLKTQAAGLTQQIRQLDKQIAKEVANEAKR